MFTKITIALVAEIERILPKNDQDKLISAMRYMLLAPAKHIRALLFIASSQVFDIKVDMVLPIATAIEFVHAYSLIHDDLPCMDNSDIRRGQLSCHKKFDEATAILTGDALLTLAFETLSSFLLSSNDIKFCEMIKALAKAVGYEGMVKGQILDLDSKDIGFQNIHLLKTAKLFAVSCEMGAIIGGATNEQRKVLCNYGTNLGLIFQAKDDIRDYKQDKISNSSLNKGGMTAYIENLSKQALENLRELSGNTDNLYSLLDLVKNKE